MNDQPAFLATLREDLVRGAAEHRRRRSRRAAIVAAAVVAILAVPVGAFVRRADDARVVTTPADESNGVPYVDVHGGTPLGEPIASVPLPTGTVEFHATQVDGELCVQWTVGTGVATGCGLSVSQEAGSNLYASQESTDEPALVFGLAPETVATAGITLGDTTTAAVVVPLTASPPGIPNGMRLYAAEIDVDPELPSSALSLVTAVTRSTSGDEVTRANLGGAVADPDFQQRITDARERLAAAGAPGWSPYGGTLLFPDYASEYPDIDFGLIGWVTAGGTSGERRPIYDTPEGDVIGYHYQHLGFVPLAEADTFDATAARIDKYGCDPIEDSDCTAAGDDSAD